MHVKTITSPNMTGVQQISALESMEQFAAGSHAGGTVPCDGQQTWRWISVNVEVLQHASFSNASITVLQQVLTRLLARSDGNSSIPQHPSSFSGAMVVPQHIL